MNTWEDADLYVMVILKWNVKIRGDRVWTTGLTCLRTGYSGQLL